MIQDDNSKEAMASWMDATGPSHECHVNLKDEFPEIKVYRMSPSEIAERSKIFGPTPCYSIKDLVSAAC